MGAKLKPVAPNVECLDIWHPRTWTESVMRAYKAADADGQIKVLPPIKISPHTGRVIIRYLSAVPHTWILEELHNRRVEIERAGEQMQMEGNDNGDSRNH